MTPITLNPINGTPLSDVDVLIQVFQAQGHFVPRREWLQWHVDHQTPLTTIFQCAGVTLPDHMRNNGTAA